MNVIYIYINGCVYRFFRFVNVSLAVEVNVTLSMYSISPYRFRVPTAESAKWIMENCRREGDDKKVSDCQTELDENEYKMRANACLDIDNEQNTVHNDQSIIAEIKSYPSSVFDLSLTDLQ